MIYLLVAVVALEVAILAALVGPIRTLAAAAALKAVRSGSATRLTVEIDASQARAEIEKLRAALQSIAPRDSRGSA